MYLTYHQCNNTDSNIEHEWYMTCAKNILPLYIKLRKNTYIYIYIRKVHIQNSQYVM